MNAREIVFDVVPPQSRKVAALVRVSTGHQTIETQKADIERVAALNRTPIDRWYEEAGVSGAAEKRPVLEELLRDARLGKFGILYVAALDRIGRSMLRTCETVFALDRLGVRVCSLRETVDTSSAMGRGVVMMCAWVAELEREMIENRTRSGLARARAKGSQFGAPPFVWSKRDDAFLIGLIGKGMTYRDVAAARLIRLKRRGHERSKFPSGTPIRERYEVLMKTRGAPAPRKMKRGRGASKYRMTEREVELISREVAVLVESGRIVDIEPTVGAFLDREAVVSGSAELVDPAPAAAAEEQAERPAETTAETTPAP